MEETKKPKIQKLKQLVTKKSQFGEFEQKEMEQTIKKQVQFEEDQEINKKEKEEINKKEKEEINKKEKEENIQKEEKVKPQKFQMKQYMRDLALKIAQSNEQLKDTNLSNPIAQKVGFETLSNIKDGFNLLDRDEKYHLQIKDGDVKLSNRRQTVYKWDHSQKKEEQNTQKEGEENHDVLEELIQEWPFILIDSQANSTKNRKFFNKLHKTNLKLWKRKRTKSLRKKKKDDPNENEPKNAPKLFHIYLDDFSKNPEETLFPFVDTCIQIIEEKGIDDEGVYRLSGSFSEINSIRKKLDEGESVDLNAFQVTTITSLFKLFFRELPETLLTQEICGKIDAVSLASPDKIEQIRSCIDQVPSLNKIIANKLFSHLHKIQLNAEKNKMNAHNLAIVFFPSLLINYEMTTFIIENYPKIYEDNKEENQQDNQNQN